MNNKIIYIIGFIIVIVLAVVFFGNKNNVVDPDDSLYPDQVKESKQQMGPKFSLSDYDGNVISSNDFEGKVLILNVWAKWCPFCVKELADFAELQRAFPDDIIVIAINRAESRKTAQGYTDEAGLTEKLVFLMDPNDSFYKSIGGFSMPETIFVDTEGNITMHKRGPMELKEMKTIIQDILNKQ